jgi:hypothetical protein
MCGLDEAHPDREHRAAAVSNLPDIRPRKADAKDQDMGTTHDVRGGGPGGTRPREMHWLVVAGLMIAAAAATTWNWDLSHRYVIGTLDNLGGELEMPFGMQSGSRSPRRLTEAQRFLLAGDTSRDTRPEQQRAIWEAHPENRVYLGNYITALAAASGSLPPGLFREELSAARKIEPDNARFDYLEAAQLLDEAAEIRSEKTGENEDGKARTEFSLEVRSREQLDEAMAILQRGLGKPYWRRYSADMLAEQLSVLGPPRRLVDLVQRTAIAASTLLPDLAKIKTLARANWLYAELLIAEGKIEEADRYLKGWNPLAKQVTEDSFTLIDVLVATAVVNDAAERIPPLFHKIDRPADAESTSTAAAAIAKPVNDWREQRRLAREAAPSNRQPRNEAVLQERAGVLASLLLPALGQWPEAQDYRAGRMLEYTVFTEFVIAVVLLSLFLAMLIGGLLAWRWRLFRRPGEPPPPILIPNAAETIRIMLIGVVLPLALFFVVTRCVPWSGHSYSMRVAGHKLMAEFGLLAMALVALPILMILGHVKRRCEARGMDVARWQARYLSGAFACLGALLLIIAWAFPAGPGDTARIVAIAGLGFLAGALVVSILLGVAQGLAGQRRHAQYYGAVFRTLVPMLALTMIVLSIMARPALVRAEAHWIERDTLMQDRERVGFTRLENDLVQELRGAMMEGFGRNRPGQKPPAFVAAEL